MAAIPLKSTVLREADYDPARKDLILTFVSGKRYAYRDVPPEVVQQLAESDSAGRFYGAVIRTGYQYTEVPEQKEVDDGS
jgi:hypothetical protein